MNGCIMVNNVTHPEATRSTNSLADNGDTVREQMNNTEPRNPPRIVNHSEDPSCRLNICMPANTSTDNKLDRTSEVPVLTARGRQVVR
ncbi:hypothetical protein JZ751_009944 [Albula glossodonta]|uniref:Uncharacterized protein n=1 Tax=Albula glossodonta TaxID=121402 RepID=A0A8T2P9R4_9TELE|nr:hypothetical protein JZ751_009944 [Albula glossodonta]